MNRALILMYHLVDKPRSEKERRFCTTPDDFSRQMAHLRASGYTVLSMAQIFDCMQGKMPMPDKAVHITFDDGFSCVLDNATPILQHYGFPATMFALSDRLGSTNDWMTTRGFPERSLLSADGLRALEDAGFTIGSHTRTHPRLPELPVDASWNEIQGSKCRLEDALGMAVTYFAYPYGKFSDTVYKQVAEAGYLMACSTRSGFNRPGEDLHLLRRIDVYGSDLMWQFKQKLKFGVNDTSRTYPFRYFAQRLAARLSI